MDNPYQAPGSLAAAEPVVPKPGFSGSLGRLTGVSIQAWLAFAGLGFLEGGIAWEVARRFDGLEFQGLQDIMSVAVYLLIGVGLEILVASPLYAWSAGQIRGSGGGGHWSSVLLFRLLAFLVLGVLMLFCSFPGLVFYGVLAVGTAFKALGRQGSVFNVRSAIWKPLLVLGLPFALLSAASFGVRVNLPGAWWIVGVYALDAVLSAAMVLALAAWMVEAEALKEQAR